MRALELGDGAHMVNRGNHGASHYPYEYITKADTSPIFQNPVVKCEWKVGRPLLCWQWEFDDFGGRGAVEDLSRGSRWWVLQTGAYLICSVTCQLQHEHQPQPLLSLYSVLCTPYSVRCDAFQHASQHASSEAWQHSSRGARKKISTNAQLQKLLVARTQARYCILSRNLL